MSKERLDLLLVGKGLFDSRPKAKAEIMAGNILVNNQKIEKAGTLVDEESIITILKKDFPYVSRGALKLLKAFEVFPLDVRGKVCLDIGASTGGFTEVMLIKGASKVFAVDVGYNQLAWKLREDERVVSLEKTNGRSITPENFEGAMMDVVVTDVSFISLEKILPSAYLCLRTNGEMIALIKPQFEAGKGEVSKKGIVSDKKTHQKVIRKVIQFAVEEVGFSALGLTVSPITGPKGNVEFLLYLQKSVHPESEITELQIKEITQ